MKFKRGGIQTLSEKPLSEGWNSRVSMKFKFWFEIIVGEIRVKSPYET